MVVSEKVTLSDGDASPSVAAKWVVWRSGLQTSHLNSALGMSRPSSGLSEAWRREEGPGARSLLAHLRLLRTRGIAGMAVASPVFKARLGSSNKAQLLGGEDGLGFSGLGRVDIEEPPKPSGSLEGAGGDCAGAQLAGFLHGTTLT